MCPQTTDTPSSISAITPPSLNYWIGSYGLHAARPAIGTIADSYIYNETDTGNSYQAQAGAWVLVGTINGLDGYGLHAARPAIGTVTDKFIYNETDTGDIYQAESGAWILIGKLKSGRAATLFIAASNASVAEKAQADYVCDGTADQAEIIAAYAALPASGGRVILSEGLFNIADVFNPPSRTILQGQGMGITTLRLTDGHTITKIIFITGKDYVTIKDMTCDGNKAGQVSAGYAIHVKNSNYVKIIDVEAVRAQMGIHFESGNYEGEIRGCVAYENCGNDLVYSNSDRGLITNSMSLGVGGGTAGEAGWWYGIDIEGSRNTIVSNNLVCNAPDLLEDIFGLVAQGENCVISHNTIRQIGGGVNARGFGIYGGLSNNVTIIGNTVERCRLGLLQIDICTNYTITGNIFRRGGFGTPNVVFNGGGGHVFSNNVLFEAVLELDGYNASLDKMLISNNIINANSTDNYLIRIFDLGAYIVSNIRIEHNMLYGSLAYSIRNYATNPGSLSWKDNYSEQPLYSLGAGAWEEGNLKDAFTGEARYASGYLTAGASDAFAFTWQNPYSNEIIVTRVLIRLSTAGGTAGSLLNVGVAADATAESDNLIDGLNLNTTGIFDNIEDKGANGKTRQQLDAKAGANDYVTGRITVANAATLAGKFYIYYVLGGSGSI